MLVKNWMSKNVITVDANDSMHDAMREHYLFLKSCLPRDEVYQVLFENKSA